MAYSDSIRTATADLNDVAGLIDGLLLTNDAYTGVSLAQTLAGSAGVFSALGSAAVTITVPASAKVVAVSIINVSHSTAGKLIYSALSEDSTSTTTGNYVLFTEPVGGTSGYRDSIVNMHVFSPTAASHTYRILWSTDANTAYCFSAKLYCLVLRA